MLLGNGWMKRDFLDIATGVNLRDLRGLLKNSLGVTRRYQEIQKKTLCQCGGWIAKESVSYNTWPEFSFGLVEMFILLGAGIELSHVASWEGNGIRSHDI